MRSFVCLSMLGLAAASLSNHKKGECVVDSGEAVSDAMDASMFIWAAYKRCGKNDVGLQVKCEVDISATIKSVSSMINVILKTVDKCDALHTANKKCGMQAGQLGEHVAGLSAAAGMVYQKCTGVGSPYNQAAANAVGAANANHIFNGQNQGTGMGAVAAPVMCTMDLKNTMKHLFKATHALQRTQHKCKDGSSHDCTVNALDIAAALSGFGSWLAGAVGQCKRAAAKNYVPDTRKALCAQATTALLEVAVKVSQDGVKMEDACKNGLTGLYEEDNVEVDAKNDVGMPTMNLVLGAFLPVTAIVGFVGGRFYGKHRPQTDQKREFFSDEE